MDLNIVICTHNRVDPLRRIIDFLNEAKRPPEANIEFFVIANACCYNTIRWLRSYQETAHNGRMLPLRWVEEPTPGKSHALNRAIDHLTATGVAFVDDDHRFVARRALCQKSALS